MSPRLPAKLWIAWVGLVHLATFYFSMFHPELLMSGAYEWALDILPLWAWGLVSLTVTGFIVASAVCRNVTLAFVGLGLALPTQVTFGLSIFILTFGDPPIISAVLGSFQWWTMAVANGLMLYAASLGRITE